MLLYQHLEEQKQRSRRWCCTNTDDWIEVKAWAFGETTFIGYTHWRPKPKSSNIGMCPRPGETIFPDCFQPYLLCRIGRTGWRSWMEIIAGDEKIEIENTIKENKSCNSYRFTSSVDVSQPVSVCAADEVKRRLTKLQSQCYHFVSMQP